MIGLRKCAVYGIAVFLATYELKSALASKSAA